MPTLSDLAVPPPSPGTFVARPAAAGAEPAIADAKDTAGSGIVFTLVNGDSYVAVGGTNDVVPPRVAKYLPERNQNARGTHDDDDGLTGGGYGLWTRTAGDQQVALDINYQVGTQRGGKHRVDLLSGVASFYERKEVRPGTTVNWGYGVGAQLYGPLGGEAIQRMIHTHGSGRIDTLQDRYTVANVRTAAVVHGAAGFSQSLYDNGAFRVAGTGSAVALISSAAGLSNVQLRLGLETTIANTVTTYLGATANHGYGGRAMHILPVNSTFFGAELRADMSLMRLLGVPLTVGVGVTTGGPLGDTVWGLQLGYGAERPFLPSALR